MSNADNEQEDRKIAEELAEKVARFVNVMTNADRVKFFIEAMHNEHRTLQQSFTVMVLEWLKHLAALPEGHYDARNKASVDIAKKLLSSVEGYDIYLPMI